MSKITGIILEVDGRFENGKLILTIEEAKALKDALDELMDKEVEIRKEYIPYTPYNPYPIYPYTYRYYYYDGTYTTDGNSSIKVTPMWEGGLRTTTGGCAQSLGGVPWTNDWSTSLCNDYLSKTHT